MLTKKITEKEINFMECWHIPRCLIESLFHNFDNLTEFKENSFGNLRLYQLPFYSDESLIDFETTAKYNKLTEKEKFQLRKSVGDSVNFGGRKFGKTLISEKLDIPISMLHDRGCWAGFSAMDGIHLKDVLNVVKTAIDSHPILKCWRKATAKSPDWEFTAKNGWRLNGINMNLKSKNPGHQFFGKHVKKLWIEEASFETEEVYGKRKDALSELGAVLRLSGMTNFTRHSPAGKAFYEPTNKEKVINLPQMVNPFWDEIEKRDRLRDFGGEDTINYRVFVKGEVVKDGVSEFDMERIEKCYRRKKAIKHFEIKKTRFENFKNVIVVERPKNADRIFLCADIGESAGTEIIILSEIGDRYSYLYNITLYSLTHDEQKEIFKWLIEKLEANVIGIDCGDALGRTLADDFEKLYGKEHVVRYAGASKIQVGFQKDNSGNILLKKGKPVYREEYMSEWSVRRLKVLLYETRVDIPMDYKFNIQFASVISTQSGTRRIFACVSEQNHLFDAWRVFSITQWLKKDFNKTPKIKPKDWGTGANSW